MACYKLTDSQLTLAFDAESRVGPGKGGGRPGPGGEEGAPDSAQLHPGGCVLGGLGGPTTRLPILPLPLTKGILEQGFLFGLV